MAKSTQQKTNGRRGKGSKYCPCMDGIAERLCEVAKPDYGWLAWILGVSERTVWSWMQRHESFKTAVENGREKYVLLQDSAKGEGG